MSRPASSLHRIFFVWLLLHAALTGYMLATRDTRAWEWSVLLLTLFTIFVLIAQRKMALPGSIKRLGWFSLAYIFLCGHGLFLYAAFQVTARIDKGERLQADSLVPLEDPVYVVQALIAILIASAIGFVGMTRTTIAINPNTGNPSTPA